MNGNQSLGQRIAEKRKQRGLTQEEVAQRLGVSPQAVSKWENDVTCPDISLLPDLASLLSVTVDVLLRGETQAETYVVPESRRKPADELLMHLTFDTDEGDKVRLNLPVGVIKALLSTGEQSTFSLGVDKGQDDGQGHEPNFNIDLERLMRLVEQGVMGKLLEVEAEGTHLSIWVE